MDDTTEPPSEHTSTPQTSPMDPQPFGPREPQPYRVVPRPPTPPPRDDDPPVQASRYIYITLEEDKRRYRERNDRLNGSPSQDNSARGYRNRAATGPGTSEGNDDAQNQPQHPNDRPQASGREPRRLELPLSKPARVALGLVSGSAVVGGLGWKLWHSRVGGELFGEAVAGSEALMVAGKGLLGVWEAVASSEALMVVGKGLLGVGAAVARGVWR